jgi:hypothetical protein
MSFRQRSVTYVKSFLRAFTREKRYPTCFKFRFVSSPQKGAVVGFGAALQALSPSQMPKQKGNAREHDEKTDQAQRFENGPERIVFVNRHLNTSVFRRVLGRMRVALDL